MTKFVARPSPLPRVLRICINFCSMLLVGSLSSTTPCVSLVYPSSVERISKLALYFARSHRFSFSFLPLQTVTSRPCLTTSSRVSRRALPTLRLMSSSSRRVRLVVVLPGMVPSLGAACSLRMQFCPIALPEEVLKKMHAGPKADLPTITPDKMKGLFFLHLACA